MKGSIFDYLANQAFFKVLRGLYLHRGSMHLRGLVRRYTLSPAGVADILQRLRNLGLIHESTVGNKRMVTLNLSSEDRSFIEMFIALHEKRSITRNITLYQHRAAEKLAWMDAAYTDMQTLKEPYAHPIKASSSRS